jgi:hypothetical protein
LEPFPVQLHAGDVAFDGRMDFAKGRQPVIVWHGEAETVNPLQRQLAALRRHLRWVVTLRGTCLAAAAVLTGLLLCGLFDSLLFRFAGVETWSLIRAGFLVITIGGAGAIAYLLLLRPLAGRTDDLSLALRVEEQYPLLNDALASTVQFLEGEKELPAGISPSLQQEAVGRALRLAKGCDFNRAIDRRGLSLSVGALVGLVALLLPLMLLRPGMAWVAFTRFTDPFGDHPWLQMGEQTQLEIDFPQHLAIGQPLAIAGKVRGVLPSKATIEFDDASLATRHVDIKAVREGEGQFVATGIKPPTYRREIRFRVKAGDAVRPPRSGDWFTVALRQPPHLTALNGKPSPQIVVHQPLYTGLAEFVKLPEGTGNIDVPAGSHVTLRAAADQPLKRAWVEFKPLLPGAKESLVLAGIGMRHPIDEVTTNALAQSTWGRIPAVLDADGKTFTVRFLPAMTGAYVLVIQDADGLAMPYEFDLNVRPDPVPVVAFLRPSTSQSVLASAELTLQVQAEDDLYALRAVYVEYRRKDKLGQWIDPAPKRILLYDHARAESGWPSLLSLLAASPVPMPNRLLHLRPRRLVLSQRMSLKGMAVEGESVVLQACAEDFNNVVAFPETGRSSEIELKVVGKTALAAVNDENEAQFQQQLLRLRDMQEKAIKKVIGAEQQWRATGQLRPEDLVDVAEAEQIQKEIEARIGTTKDEGLRAELGQFEEMLKENKLAKSEIADRARAIREALDKISRENLPRIEPGLSKARRELDSPTQPRAPDPKDQGDLGDARGEQEKIQAALAELLDNLKEQATLQQVKGELRAVLQEQQQRQKEVEKLSELHDLKGGWDNLKKDAQVKGELRRTAILQGQLSDRAQRVIDELERLGKAMADKGERGIAEMLERAAQIGTEETVPRAMTDTSNRLEDGFDTLNSKKRPDLHTALKTQDGIVQSLERMLDALDQTRADEVARLIVHQKKEKQNLEELADHMAKLKKKIENARKIADPKERENELKKLADEQRELQQMAEKRGRELSKAQAKEAADDVKEAARKMERLARMLERDDDPDEALREIEDHLKDAQSDLRDAQEAADQELSREQIAKIVDRLKGLKDRQDGVVAESERLRKEFLQSKYWQLSKVTSLGDLKSAQTVVGDETGMVRDKLKGAKVFHVILDRAVKDMIGATASIDAWRKTANLHKEGFKKSDPRPVLKEKDFEDEKAAFEATAKLQHGAADRLQRLIDALLPELEAADQQPKDQDPNRAQPKPGNGKDAPPKQQQKGGIAAQDGIPPVAQLKALKAEQLEINARTKELAERQPDLNALTPDQRAELEAMSAEQDRLLQVFRELITSAKGGEDKQ